ncbi:MAG: aldehyde dehydrogenase family protein [Moraxellaceae bacterium]|nr:aldehyde dehydrogenase family protein [Pseudobdellovibrionaceae bacterium]
MKAQLPAEKIIAHSMIHGEWVPGRGDHFSVRSPYNHQIIGEVTCPDAEQIDLAVKAAAAAQKEWAAVSMKERAKILFQFRHILMRDLDKISHIKASESGKTFEEGKAGLMKGIEVLEYALSLQNLDTGGRMEVSRGVSCEYRREPLGVILNITPFNFPAMVPMWTIPINLALGNAYVWKPSEKTPLTSVAMANALSEAGLPKGLMTVLHGGASTVEKLIDHPLIKAIGFVGSTSIAKKVYDRGTQLGKRVLALGGAKNHIILLPDASTDISGSSIADSFTGCAGQRCMAASVLLAVGNDPKINQHIEKIKERASSMVLGENMGAIITKEQVKFLSSMIEKAEKDGATIILDGRKAKAPAGLEEGNWIGPTILDHVKPGSHAAVTELFGPILSIVRVKDLTEAIEIENSVEYGNACSIFTSSGAFADRVIREASTGMVGVNVGVPVPREPFSFGGINASKYGHGDITGAHSLDFWSNVKKVTVKWEKQTDSSWMS